MNFRIWFQYCYFGCCRCIYLIAALISSKWHEVIFWVPHTSVACEKEWVLRAPYHWGFRIMCAGSVFRPTLIPVDQSFSVLFFTSVVLAPICFSVFFEHAFMSKTFEHWAKCNQCIHLSMGHTMWAFVGWVKNIGIPLYQGGWDVGMCCISL